MYICICFTCIRTRKYGGFWGLLDVFVDRFRITYNGDVLVTTSMSFFYLLLLTSLSSRKITSIHPLSHCQELRPHVIVTYNGDFFDWPYVDKRCAKYGISLYSDLGIKLNAGECHEKKSKIHELFDIRNIIYSDEFLVRHFKHTFLSSSCPLLHSLMSTFIPYFSLSF